MADDRIDQYRHEDKQRKNNPPVGLVSPETDQDGGPTRYEFDPHLDPQLIWSGKKRTEDLEIPTVSLHTHERIDPQTILEKVRKEPQGPQQISLFESVEEDLPLRQAIDFYEHEHGWSNRLIAGDSLLVMNSLLQKEGLADSIQMVYFDPPYGIDYGSNFQPFVGDRSVPHEDDEYLTREPEMVQAYRDTWELGIHSYLTYLRERLRLVRELLPESGGIFFQIGVENMHFVRCILDEIFGPENHMATIIIMKQQRSKKETFDQENDFILWYAKDKEEAKFRPLYREKDEEQIEQQFTKIELPDRSVVSRKKYLKEHDKIPEGARLFHPQSIFSRSGSESTSQPYEWEGETYEPSSGYYWSTNQEGLERLDEQDRLFVSKRGSTLRRKVYLDERRYERLTNVWEDSAPGGFNSERIYVVQTASKVVERCINAATEPGDIVFDPTCGSGTTAFAAERLGRRWITCDTSRVAVNLAKQRLLTATYGYYKLANPKKGVTGDFEYEIYEELNLRHLTTDEEPEGQPLYDKPIEDKSKGADRWLSIEAAFPLWSN
ncbi:hypothetical protein BRD56_04565 [Thermoplasmatales archaeon SW_10_69_26]|nr:MAG: hypothetical protein BRD56_04565 [Thermoplasmatales archaeon SW_10_69_26]